MIKTFFVAIWVVFWTFICGSTVILISLFKQGGAASHFASSIWGLGILVGARVKVSVEGGEHIDPQGTYVYMANHQSMFDIPILLGHLPTPFRWLAKKELFDIPFFGLSIKRAGYISIDRSNRKSAHESIVEAARKISSGASVVIFPEGTRSEDGTIQPFKSGGFHLALRSGKPIVPVVIHGAHPILPKGRFRIQSGKVIVSIGSPIETVGFTGSAKKNLEETVRNIMVKDFERINERPA